MVDRRTFIASLALSIFNGGWKVGENEMIRPLRHSVDVGGNPVALPSIFGKVSHFGGVDDHTTKKGERDFLNRFKLSQLDTNEDFYIAMRWAYEQPGLRHMKIWEAQEWWAGQRIRIWDIAFSRAVVAWVADWGPGIHTRSADVSRRVLQELAIKTDDYAFFEFVDKTHPIGVVELKGDVVKCVH